MYGLESKEKVREVVDRYHDLFADENNIEERKKNYSTMVVSFYNLVTQFYEFGWGHSFHFAPRHKGESFEASIARQEFYLALRLHLQVEISAS